MNQPNLVTLAISLTSLSCVAQACGVSYQSVRKWEKNGRLPRTEWTGETEHAANIERATCGQVTREQLLHKPT